jgi:maltose alpha-D-glucosyltransferase/alpha-amylase
VLLEARGRHETANYLLPTVIKWTRFNRERQDPSALAPLRRGPREGSLLDATADASFVALLLENLRAARTIEGEQRRLEFAPTARFPDDGPITIQDVQAVDTEQSNTTVLVGTDYVIKLFRRLERGLNPEIEVGRFLTETVQFAHTPPLLGTVELEEDGARSPFAVVHAFVQNHGDAWTLTGHYLDRFVEEQRLLPAEAAGHSDEEAAYLRRMDRVGRRVAELQLALASRDDIADFAPEAISADDARSWTEALAQQAERQFDLLAQRRSDLVAPARIATDKLLNHRSEALARIRGLLPTSVDVPKARHYGDFHLGQMLFVKDDVFMLYSEAQRGRSVQERRRKMPAARDS